MKTGKTNDHYVPQMYLRRWGVGGPKGHQVAAANADNLEQFFLTGTRNIASENGFYWGTDPDGVPHHDMETFLGRVEDDATAAFRFILDHGTKPSDNALPSRWPTRTDHRLTLAWWIAAQLVRTEQQRARLWRLADQEPADAGGTLRANQHLAYIAENVAPLAGLVFRRPWGIGFSSACLLTSDAPVQLLNAQDDSDQLAAAAYWDIYLPLDPHRFLFLPGDDPERPDLAVDHQVDMSNVTTVFNEVLVETAQRHVFWHPDHDPRSHMNLATTVSIRKNRPRFGGSEVMVNYAVLPPGLGVERRWLTSHPPVGADASSGDTGAEDPRQVLENLSSRLRERHEGHGRGSS